VIAALNQEIPSVRHYFSTGRKKQRQAASFLRRLVAGFSPRRRPEFEPGSGHVGYMMDKVALGQVLSEYFGFPCQCSFYQLLHNIIIIIIIIM
jgi:hypothetical protein